MGGAPRALSYAAGEQKRSPNSFVCSYPRRGREHIKELGLRKYLLFFKKMWYNLLCQTKLNIEIRLTLAKGIVYLFILLPKMNYGKNAIPLG